MFTSKSREEFRRTLLLEMHRAISASSNRIRRALEAGVSMDDLTYPPAPTLTHSEVAALASQNLSTEAISALGKLVADATALAFFDLLCVIDGVADPQVHEADIWLGARIRAATEDDADESMWHDDLFESYWDYVSEKKG